MNIRGYARANVVGGNRGMGENGCSLQTTKYGVRCDGIIEDLDSGLTESLGARRLDREVGSNYAAWGRQRGTHPIWNGKTEGLDFGYQIRWRR